MAAKAFVDQWIGKLTSRKLLVWLTATAAVFADKITSDDWVIISGIYIGTQSVIDGIAKLRG